MHARSCSSAAATSIHVASARARPAWSIRLAGARAEARRRIASSHEQKARDTSSCAALPMHADRCALLCPRASHASAHRARARATGRCSSRSAALLVRRARSYSRSHELKQRTTERRHRRLATRFVERSRLFRRTTTPCHAFETGSVVRRLARRIFCSRVCLYWVTSRCERFSCASAHVLSESIELAHGRLDAPEL